MNAHTALSAFATAPFRRSITLRRFFPFLLVASLGALFILQVFHNLLPSWLNLPLFVIGERKGPTAEQIASGRNILPDLRSEAEQNQWQETNSSIEDISPYPKGQTKPPGSNYTTCLVVSKMKKEDTDWIEQELGDMIHSGSLTTAVYTVDDRKAKLRPPKQKGHEVMVYLSYIIDNYDDLPDVSIFMHAHQFSWHNNELLDTDAAQMVRHLSAERVTREGYMNLRCHWDPGCPDWLHPGTSVKNDRKQEEALLASSWKQLFPIDPIPTALAQPCCAQFAVSRSRILKTNKMRYIYMRDWLKRTDMSDFLSGRIFEYIWQFIFSATPILCPSMHAWHCDGYGICFENAKASEEWFELMFERNEYKEQLRVWREKAELIKEWEQHAKDGKLVEPATLEVPKEGQDIVLKGKIAQLEEEMGQRKQKAIELGKDPKQRALASGRKWKKGDGY